MPAKNRPAVLELARPLVEAGLHVLLLIGKIPHPGHGWKDATTDLDELERRARANPAATNVGFQPGLSGHVGVDLDETKPAASVPGLLRLQQIAAERGGWPATLTARTGSGGRHLIFREHPTHALGQRNGVPNPALGGEVESGVDHRGAKGYLVAAGSLHPDTGRPYRWETPSGRFEPELVLPIPDWLVEALDPPRAGLERPKVTPITPSDRDQRRVAGMVARCCERLARLGPGMSRRTALQREAYRLGGYLWTGYPRSQLQTQLEDAAHRCGHLDPDTQRCIACAIADGEGRPMELPPDSYGSGDRALDLQAARQFFQRREGADDSGDPGEPPNDPDPPPDDPDPPDASRAEVLVGARLDVLVLDAAATLVGAGLYVQGGRLAAVDEGRVSLVTADRLLPVLSARADYVRLSRDPEGNVVRKRQAPPKDLAKMLVARGSHPELEELVGVTRSPVLRPDGSIVATPGYDPETRLVYLPVGDAPEVPRRPTKDDAVRALAELIAVVDEYPFARPADRSAWLALPLTLAARTAIRGCTPFFASIANQARSGKTTIVQIGGLIGCGTWVGPSRWPGDGDELGKRIDSIVLGGEPLALFDNLRGPIVGEALEAAITTTSYTPRILGLSQMPTVAQRTVFSATANGASFAGDMPGRTLPVRLYTPDPHPERRTFRRTDLRGYVETHRARLHAAALTVASAYLQAGCPGAALVPWGSFEAWSALIRGALVWLDQPDPCEARTDLGSADLSGSDHDRLVAFAAATFGEQPWASGLLADRIESVGMATLDHDLGGGWTIRDARELAAELGVWSNKAVDRLALGKLLTGRVDRPASDGTRICRAVDEAGKPRRSRTGSPLYQARRGVAGVSHG